MNDILIGFGLLFLICTAGVCCVWCECFAEICMANQIITEPDNETPVNNHASNVSSPVHDDTKFHIEI
jgi:hypothetical protein